MMVLCTRQLPWRYVSFHFSTHQLMTRVKTLLIRFVLYFSQSVSHTHNHFMALVDFVRNNPGEPVPEVHFAIFWIFWSKIEITQADAPTILMDFHPIQTDWCPHLYHLHHFYAGCPSLHNPPNLSWLGKLGQAPNMLLAYPVAWLIPNIIYALLILACSLNVNFSSNITPRSDILFPLSNAIL